MEHAEQPLRTMTRDRRRSRLWMFVLLVLSMMARTVPQASASESQLLVPEGEPLPDPLAAAALRIGRVQALAYNHQGTALAWLAEDNRLCIGSPKDGAVLLCNRSLSASQPVRLVFLPDDKWLAVAYRDGHIDIRSTSPERWGESCSRKPLPESLGFGRATTALGVAARDQSLIALGSKDGTSRRWTKLLASGLCSPREAEQASLLRPLQGIPVGLWSASALASAGDVLAVGVENSVGIWDVDEGQALWVNTLLGAHVVALAFSADDRWLAVGTTDGTLQMFDRKTGNPRVLPGQARKRLTSLAFSPDGSRLAVTTEDRKIWIHALDSQAPPTEIKRDGAVTALAFRPDGRELAVASEEAGITLYETTHYQPQRTLRGNADWIRSLAISPDGARLATASDDGQVRIWQRQPGHAPEWRLSCRTPPGEGPVRALAFRPPTGDQLAVVSESRMLRLFHGNTCDPAAWPDEASTGKAPATETSTVAGPWLRSLAFDADGRRLAVGSDDGRVRIWDLETTPRLIADLPGHRDSVTALAFSPTDSNLLFSGSYDRTVRFWDVSQGKTVHTLEAHAAGIRSLVASADGNQLAAAAASEVRLWHVAERRLLATLNHAEPERGVTEPVLGSLFDVQAPRLIVPDRAGGLRSWDLTTHKEQAWASPLPPATAKDAPRSDGVLSFAAHSKTQLAAIAGLGRVVLMSLGDLTKPQAVLWQANDEWASWQALPQAGGRLFRNDSGGLLWQVDNHGMFRPLLPSAPSLPARLTLQFTRVAVPPSDLEDIEVSVFNKAESGPALWVRWELLRPDDTLDSRWLEARTLPSTIMRLEPGETREIPRIQLSLGPGWFWPWQNHTFCLAARPLYGEPGHDCVNFSLTRSWWLRWHRYPKAAAGLLSVGCLFILLGWLLRISAFNHPAVRALRTGLDPLAQYRLDELPALNLFLARTEAERGKPDLRQRILTAAGLDEHRFLRALQFVDSPTSSVAALCQALLARPEPTDAPALQTPELLGFRVQLPPLLLVQTERCLIVCSRDPASPTHTELIQCPRDRLGTPPFVLVLERSRYGPPPADVKRTLVDAHPATVFVFLSEAQQRAILFSPTFREAKQHLCRAIVEQCNRNQILPYRLGGNGLPDADARFFFGRDQELQHLLHHYQRNFLLIGPRQMGKTSLLFAFHRELERRYPNLIIYSQHLRNGKMHSIHTKYPHLSTDTADSFYQSVLRHSSQHQVFLLDETDDFLALDQSQGYAFSSAMRALSSDGRASFFLAGHQALHDAARTSDHPLRNFGQILRLGPLDPQAAERMLMEPLEEFGLRFETASLSIEWLRSQTACRPNLLAFVGTTLISHFPPFRPAPLSHAEITECVLSTVGSFDVFDRWTGTQGSELVDNLVMRAALLLERCQQADLEAFLIQQGAPLSSLEVDASISRLYARHYGLIVDADGTLICPVPLFRHFISDPRPGGGRSRRYSSAADRLRDELARDIRAWNAERLACGSRP